MSLPIVVTPSTGATWATAWEQFEGIRKGMIALSLTNYDATTVPQIASGSWIECAGAIHKAASNQTITGSLTSDAINYVTLVPSGTGASAILTPTWASGAPTWSDAYQGYYSGTTRYAGGCYYDGTNYILKWVYMNRHAGPRTRYISPAFTGETNDPADMVFSGAALHLIDCASGRVAYIAVPLDTLFGIVTELYGECGTFTDGSVTVTLAHAGHDSSSGTTMAQVTLDAAEFQTDSTITDPVIDTENEQYYVIIACATAASDLYVTGLRIKITEIARC